MRVAHSFSPIFFREAEWSTRRFRLALTVREVENSPNIDLDHPVSRQHERDYYAYYRYTPYWGYSALWGVGASPGMLAEARSHEPPPHPADPLADDVHLRSAGEVRGYHIEGSDAAIGHVEDFIVDDETWEVRYLVIDTSNWWFGKKVLVAPHWATRVSWQKGTVYIDMSRRAIQDSPEWHPPTAVDREYEERLYDHYGRAPYWVRPDSRAAAQVTHHSGVITHDDADIHRNEEMVTMSTESTAVAVFGTHGEAEHALRELQRGGIDMKTLSIVGKGYHTDEHAVGYYSMGDRMKHWGKTGALWGGIWGLLFGSALFLIPGLGPILAAGPIVGWIVAALESAVVVGGVSALGAGLYSLGIPKDSIIKYETAIKSDRFLLIAHGTAAEIARAHDIIESSGPAALTLHSAELETAGAR